MTCTETPSGTCGVNPPNMATATSSCVRAAAPTRNDACHCVPHSLSVLLRHPIRSCRPLPFVALSTAGQSEAHRRGKEKRNRKTKAAVAVVPSAAAVVVQGPRLLVSCRDPNKRATGGKSAGGVRFAAPGLVRPTPTHPRVRRLSRRAPTARASFPSLSVRRRARARVFSVRRCAALHHALALAPSW
jgi:hypothetical protein